MTTAPAAIAGSKSSLNTSLRLSRFSIVTSFPFVIASRVLRIIALRVAFVFLAIHLLMYAMMLDAVSSSSSAVILRIPPFFLILYSICTKVGSSISGKSAASSTLSNGVESASTSIFRVPVLVVTPSTLTYCSRLSDERRSSMMSVLMSSGIVTPIPTSPSPLSDVSDVIVALYTAMSASSASLCRNPALTMFTNDFTMFFLSGFVAPPTCFTVPLLTLSSMFSCSSSSKS